jgi:predicted alpha/beta-hydrolase family hydrolase
MVRIYLGHGAWSTAAAMAPWLDGLAARGYEAHAMTLPRGHADRAATAFLAQIPDEPGVVVGGQSYGGRAASILAARDGARETGRVHPVAGLVCLCYPLHRPGHPETAPERTAHWERITVPSLLLSGERDPFARLPLLVAAATAIADRELVTWPRVGHSLAGVREEALDRVAVFLRAIERR